MYLYIWADFPKGGHKLKEPHLAFTPPPTPTAGWTAASATPDYSGLWEAAWDWSFTLKETDMFFRDHKSLFDWRMAESNSVGTT